MRVEPEQLNQLLRPIFDPKEKEKTLKSGNLMTKGLNAGLALLRVRLCIMLRMLKPGQQRERRLSW